MSQMKTRTLGGTGIPVSEMALGAMMLGPMGNTERDESVAIIHAALDAGITLIDTADVYSGGVSEEIVGAAIKGRRDDVVLATKVGFPFPGRGALERGGSPRWIKAAVEASLRRLGTEYIDLYQLHRPDYTTSIEETLGAFDDLIRAGKIRAAGASMYPAELITEAQWVAERRGLHRFWTEQPRYSILNRTPETAVFPTTERFGMGVLTFGPLGSGGCRGAQTFPPGTAPPWPHRDLISRYRATRRRPQPWRVLPRCRVTSVSRCQISRPPSSALTPR